MGEPSMQSPRGIFVQEFGCFPIPGLPVSRHDCYSSPIGQSPMVDKLGESDYGAIWKYSRPKRFSAA